MFHEDRKGVDDMILEQYRVGETECGLEGCTKVFSRDVSCHVGLSLLRHFRSKALEAFNILKIVNIHDQIWNF